MTRTTASTKCNDRVETNNLPSTRRGLPVVLVVRGIGWSREDDGVGSTSLDFQEMSNLASGPRTRGTREGGVVDVRRVMKTTLGLPMVVGSSKAVNVTSTSSTYAPSNL
jgi:hypothetical protein